MHSNISNPDENRPLAPAADKNSYNGDPIHYPKRKLADFYIAIDATHGSTRDLPTYIVPALQAPSGVRLKQSHKLIIRGLANLLRFQSVPPDTQLNPNSYAACEIEG